MLLYNYVIRKGGKMYSSVAVNFNNISPIMAEKGVVVIDMRKKDTINHETVENELLDANFEEEPSEEELKKIDEGKDTSNRFENDDDLLEDEKVVGGINVFGKTEVDYYIKQIVSIPICTPEEEREYFEKIKKGDAKAKEEFITRNLRLVLKSALKYQNRMGSCTLADLIQEGNIGLLKAVERFDPTKGFKFSTYATWWIRQGISRGVADQSRTVRIPVHMMEWVNRYKRVMRDYEQTHGFEPGCNVMAELLNISLEKAIEIAKFTRETVSLSAPVGEEEDSTLAEFIPSIDIPVEEVTENKELVNVVRKMINELKPREREVIMARYGIGDGRPKTLEEVGQSFGVTRERIRQIEAKALRSLKRRSNRNDIELKEFLN